MAKQEGPLKFTGTIGNLTGWKGPDGEYYVKAKSSLNKEKIDSYPSMEPQRKMRKYFSLAASQARQLRKSLEPFTSIQSDRQIHHRLTQSFQNALIASYPQAAPKTYDFSAAKDELEGFAFDPKHSILQFVTSSKIKYSDEGWIDLDLGPWHIANGLIKQAGADHFRWVVVVAALTAKPTKDKRNKIIPSPWMPIDTPQSWQCPIEFGPYQTQGGAVVIALVAESATRVGTQFYTTQTIRAMNILQFIA